MAQRPSYIHASEDFTSLSGRLTERTRPPGVRLLNVTEHASIAPSRARFIPLSSAGPGLFDPGISLSVAAPYGGVASIQPLQGEVMVNDSSCVT